MIGKLIGAFAGAKAASHVRGIGGTGGALLGAAAPAVIRRLGPVTLIAAAAGGYALKRYSDKRQKSAGKPEGRPSAT